MNTPRHALQHRHRVGHHLNLRELRAGCPPGEYRGSVRLIHAGGTRDLPLVLEILPIRLIEHPQKQLACYYDMKNLLDRSEVLRELADLRGHGVRHLVTGLEGLGDGIHRCIKRTACISSR